MFNQSTPNFFSNKSDSVFSLGEFKERFAAYLDQILEGRDEAKVSVVIE